MLDPVDTDHVRRRRHVQQGPEQLRSDHRLRLGRHADGKTAVRAGYSLTFVNEETVTVGRTASRGNTGLSSTPVLSNQFARVSSGVPEIATPAFLSTRTLGDQLATSATATLWGLDPSLQAPHVHQVSVGIQRELGFATAVEARYVGTLWTRHLARHRLQPSAAHASVPGRLQPCALQRLPGATVGPSVQLAPSTPTCQAASR